MALLNPVALDTGPAAETAGICIRAQSVSKDYRKGKLLVPVLDRFNLEVRTGEFLVLMGSSGCGKTTLLNLIGGLDQPSAGSIRVNGTDLGRLGRTQLSDWRGRHVGFIFQFYNLLPSLTAAQNVELPLLIQGCPAAERREKVEDCLNLVGLRDRGTHRPDELSGGQQQRVAIARAIISDPDILLCDEPTGDLDRSTGLRIMEILQLLNREMGKTIVLATHDPEVAGFADRTLHLSRVGAEGAA